jgi:integrase
MVRQLNRLTPAKLRTLKEPGYYNDGLGLYLQISKWRTRAWVYRYTIDGTTRYLGLGPEHTVTLAMAREKARDARLLVLEGKDPIEVKREARDQRRAQANDRMLFKDALERFLQLHEPTWKNAKHRWQWHNSLEKYAKALNNRPVAAIDGAVITETLAPIWTSKAETARRVKQRIERVIQWVKDGQPLPAQAGKDVRHHAAMPFDELPDFMAELSKRKGSSPRALEFTILTAARTSEVLGARWVEIDGGVWVVPPSRMKSGRPHRVPLSPQAKAVLKALPRDRSGFIFPGAREGEPLSNMAMLGLVKDMREGLTVHGFRSSFSDWARERTNYPRDVVEMALAHAIKDKTEAAYRRGDALPKRTALMQDWADFACSPTVEATVTPIRAAV